MAVFKNLIKYIYTHTNYISLSIQTPIQQTELQQCIIYVIQLYIIAANSKKIQYSAA